MKPSMTGLTVHPSHNSNVKSNQHDHLPNSEEVLEKAGCLMIEEYIQQRRDTILLYARSTDIYGRCKSAKKIGSNLLWWELVF
jgi:hypothetical protein